MLNESEIRNAIGATAYGADEQKIGKVGQVFLDDQTGQPEFATVNTGLFGTSESFVPLADAIFDGNNLRVPFTKERVKEAPNVDVESGHLDQDQERRLYDYYGLSYTEAASNSGLPDSGLPDSGLPDSGLPDSGLPDSGLPDAGLPNSGLATDVGTGTPQPTGYDTSGPTTDDAMTRSEEHLTVGKQSEEAGRARLRKYVVTEQETVTVPVQKERATIEREPITDANIDEAVSGPEISEEEHEVVLHEERPVVETTAEPVERVRLGTETTTQQETVSGDVRKEQIEAEGDVDERR